MDFERLTQVMRRLALEAGDRIMEVYNAPSFEVKAKSDASPVTEADEAGSDAPGEWRPDFCPFEIPAGLLEIRQSGGDARIRFLQLGNAEHKRGRGLFVADILPIEARLFGPCFFLGEGCFSACEPGLGCHELGAEIGRVQLEQDIARIEKRAILEQAAHGFHRAWHLGGEQGGVMGSHGALGLQDNRKAGPVQHAAGGLQFLCILANGCRLPDWTAQPEPCADTEREDEKRYENP